MRLGATPKSAATPKGTELDSDVAQRVCEIVADVSAVQAQEIGPSTRLREDLNLVGDDVDDLFLELQEQFHTDWSDLDFHRYFKEEPHLLWPILFLYRGLVHGKWGNGTITVEHLIRVVESGKWTNPDQIP